MKRIIITESQYDKLLLFEQDISAAHYYCIKKDYSDKGKVIELDDRKAFKMVNKNNDKVYFIEDGKFIYIQNGKGWKNTGKYNCNKNEYVIKKEKGELYEFINNFLTNKPIDSKTPKKDDKSLSLEKAKDTKKNCWDGTTLASVVKFMKFKATNWKLNESNNDEGCQACYINDITTMCFKSDRYYTLTIKNSAGKPYEDDATIVRLEKKLSGTTFNEIVYKGVWYTYSSLVGDNIQNIDMKLDLRKVSIDGADEKKLESKTPVNFKTIIKALVDTISKPTEEEKVKMPISDVDSGHYQKLSEYLGGYVDTNKMIRALEYVKNNFNSFDEWNKFNKTIKDKGKKTPTELFSEVGFWLRSGYNNDDGSKKILIGTLDKGTNWDQLSATIDRIKKDIE